MQLLNDACLFCCCCYRFCFCCCSWRCYLLPRRSNTNCIRFALRSFLIKSRSTFHTFFIFTLLPGSPALLRTPKCSLEYHPSALRPEVSAISLKLPRSNILEPTPYFYPPCYCQSFEMFLENISPCFQELFFSPIVLRCARVCVCLLSLIHI